VISRSMRSGPTLNGQPAACVSFAGSIVVTTGGGAGAGTVVVGSDGGVVVVLVGAAVAVAVGATVVVVTGAVVVLVGAAVAVVVGATVVVVTGAVVVLVLPAAVVVLVGCGPTIRAMMTSRTNTPATLPPATSQVRRRFHNGARLRLGPCGPGWSDTAPPSGIEDASIMHLARLDRVTIRRSMGESLVRLGDFGPGSAAG